jgi:hypothetical protein
LRARRETRTKVMALKAHHPAMEILAAHDPAAAGWYCYEKPLTT